MNDDSKGDERRLIFDETAGDKNGAVQVSTQIFDDGTTVIRVVGLGSVEGMDASAKSFEAGLSKLGATPARVRLDLAGFTGAPLHAQLRLVAWMIRFQDHIGYLGVVGGDQVAIRVARAIYRLLPFRQRVAFFETAADFQRSHPYFRKAEAT